MLGFGYPEVHRLRGWQKSNPMRFKLPQPIINKAGCNLSASLKTAVLRRRKKLKQQEKYDLAASFQETINKKKKKKRFKKKRKKIWCFCYSRWSRSKSLD